MSDPNFYKIFDECKVSSYVHQHFATDIAERARDRVIARDADLARRPAGGPYGRPDCYHTSDDSTSSEEGCVSQQPVFFACEAILLKTFQRDEDNRTTEPERPEMWRFMTWLVNTGRWNINAMQCQRRQIQQSRDQAQESFDCERQKHSSVNSYSLRKAKAKYDEELQSYEATIAKLDTALDRMMEWQWLMYEIWRLLCEDCDRGIASLSFATFVARCSPFEKKTLYWLLDEFGDIIDWETTEAAIRDQSYEEALSSPVPIHIREDCQHFREYPPLPDPYPDDLANMSDPRPQGESRYDEYSIFGTAWQWWISEFQKDPDLIHYRSDGTYEERGRGFWRRHRDQKLEEAEVKAQKAQQQRKVPGMTTNETSGDDSDSSVNTDDELDPDTLAERMQHTHITDSHLTGTSSTSRHKRTHGKKKGGSGTKKGKRSKKQGKR